METLSPGSLLRASTRAFAAVLFGGSLVFAEPWVIGALSGGLLSVKGSAITAGGAKSSGGGFTLASAIGAPSTPMSGGPFTLKPGALAAAQSARLTLDTAHAFPTPFLPSRGHDRLTFTNLSSVVTVNVYTISGQKVKTLTKNDASSDSLIWYPVANELGHGLASGVYIFVVSAPGLESRRGKFMIVK